MLCTPDNAFQWDFHQSRKEKDEEEEGEEEEKCWKIYKKVVYVYYSHIGQHKSQPASGLLGFNQKLSKLAQANH